MYILFKVIILIIVVYLSMSTTLYILYEEFTNNDNLKKKVNPNIYRDAIIVQESHKCDDREKLYRNIFMKKIPNSSLLSVIKYIDGIEWSKWNSKMYNENIINDVNKNIQSYLQDIIDKQTKNIIIVDSQFRQCKTDKNNKKHVLLDFDIIFHEKDMENADYLRLLFVLNSEKLDVIFIKLIGEIHKDKLYVDIGNIQGLNKSSLPQHDVSKHESYSKELFNYEDTFNNIQSEDERVQNILYNRLMESNLEEDPLYIENKIHTINQNAVRKYFTNKLKS
mgnify:FL=1